MIEEDKQNAKWQLNGNARGGEKNRLWRNVHVGTKNERYRAKFRGTVRLLFDVATNGLRNLEKEGSSGNTYDACNTHVGEGGAGSVGRGGGSSSGGRGRAASGAT